MEPPRFLEEEPTALRHGLLTVEKIVHGRNGGAVGVTSLHRLIELLRIAEQHNSGCSLRNGQQVSEADLRRFVDKQDVDGSYGLRTSPQPRSSGGDLARRSDGVQELGI